jgi:hypothetical protein
MRGLLTALEDEFEQGKSKAEEKQAVVSLPSLKHMERVETINEAAEPPYAKGGAALLGGVAVYEVCDDFPEPVPRAGTPLFPPPHHRPQRAGDAAEEKREQPPGDENRQDVLNQRHYQPQVRLRNCEKELRRIMEVRRTGFGFGAGRTTRMFEQ